MLCLIGRSGTVTDMSVLDLVIFFLVDSSADMKHVPGFSVPHRRDIKIVNPLNHLPAPAHNYFIDFFSLTGRNSNVRYIGLPSVHVTSVFLA